MFFLVLMAAVAYFLYLALAGGLAPVAAFLTASASLYTWYWYLALGLAAVGVLLLMLAVIRFEGLIELIIGSRLSHFVLKDVGGFGLAAMAGPGLILFSGALFIFKAALFLGGSYLLMTSGSIGDGLSDLSLWRIIVAIVMFLIGLFVININYTSEHTETTTITYR